MMIPVLLSFGPIKLYTLSLFLVLAFLWGGFVVAKKAKEYHIEEMEIYDGIVLSIFIGGGLAKVMDVIGYSGLGFLGLWVGVLISALILSKKEELKLYTILDLFSLGILMAMVWWTVGEFWSGNLNGVVVDQVWGLPIGETRVFPIELIAALMYLAAFVFSWKTERSYRTFGWYRGKKSSANTGFILGLGLILSGTINLIKSALSRSVAGYVWYEMALLMVIGVVVIYHRSGRSLQVDFQDLASKVRRGR